ncbi:ATP synthase F0 subunit B [Trichothermofontia sp.]
MLRQDSSRTDPDRNGSSYASRPTSATRGNNVDIQRELNRLEELILDSTRIPLTRWTLIDEEQFLEQLDLVRLSLPAAFREAQEVVQQREEILLETEQYARSMIEAAEQRAAQIKDDLGIIQQAEMEARQIWQQVQQECEAAREQTRQEIEQMRRQAQQELSEAQRRTLMECESLEQGADEYADRVLNSIEQQLNDMMRIIRNGRQQLQRELSSSHTAELTGSQPRSAIRPADSRGDASPSRS